MCQYYFLGIFTEDDVNVRMGASSISSEEFRQRICLETCIRATFIEEVVEWYHIENLILNNFIYLYFF
jgi:hypothetical protein